MKTPPDENTLVLRLALAFLALAAAGATYLLANSLLHGPVLGCGEGSGCDNVLQSRYAYLLPGVPVTVPALGIYAVLFLCVLRRRRHRENPVWRFATLASALLVLGAAACFIAIQAIKLKQFCPFCMATHALGATAAVLVIGGLRFLRRETIGAFLAGGLAAGGALATMLAFQYFIPQKTFVEGKLPDGAEKLDGRRIALGDLSFNLDDVPHWGNSESEKLVVVVFDYTCRSCRITHRYLHRAEERFGLDSYLVVGLPVPLHPACNPDFPNASPEHANACAHARLALALWRLDPAGFREWDRWMFDTGTVGSAPSPADARAKAESVADAAKLDLALADPWIDAQLARDIAAWKAIKTRMGRMTMPQMVLGSEGNIVLGAPDSEFQLFDLMAYRLKLSPLPQAAP